MTLSCFTATISILLTSLTSYAFMGGQPLLQNKNDDFPLTHSIVAVIGDPETAGQTCGGVLISHDLVLTASHCLAYGSQVVIAFTNYPLNPDLKIYHHPVPSVTRARGLVRDVDQTRALPNYGGPSDPFNFENGIQYFLYDDMAILHFKGDLPSGYQVAPLLEKSSMFKIGSAVNMAGYGETEPGNISSAGHLNGRQAVQTYPQMWGTDGNGNALIIPVIENPDLGICYADSGTPVSSSTDSKIYVVGINVAATDESCMDGFAEILAVGPRIQWIQSIIREFDGPK